VRLEQLARRPEEEAHALIRLLARIVGVGIETADMLVRVEPLAWLTDVLERMVSGRTKAHVLECLLPWTWKVERLAAAVNA
jgi:hypothetical protein